MNIVMQRLDFMEEIILRNLPENVKLFDLVHRPFDMELFGKKGYSFVLIEQPDKMMGLCLQDPTKISIKKGIKEILEIFSSIETVPANVE